MQGFLNNILSAFVLKSIFKSKRIKKNKMITLPGSRISNEKLSKYSIEYNECV